MVLAFTTVSALLGSSIFRGLASLFFGVTLGLVGIDLQTGQARFTPGVPQLLGGIDVVIVAVGLFAVGETFFVAARHKWEQEEILPVKGWVWLTKEEWRSDARRVGTEGVSTGRSRWWPYRLNKTT